MKKKLNTVTLCGLMIGPILGSGIILLPPLVYNLTGNLSIFVWLLILLFGFAFALVLANLSIKFPGDEGVTNAVEAAFSSKLKYLTSYYLISAVFFGPVAVYFVGAQFLQPLVGLDTTVIALLMLLFVCFTLMHPINFLGTISLITTTIVGIILTVGSCATLLGQETTYSLTATFDLSIISKALLLAFWSIVGWEVVGNYSKEVECPKTMIPKATKISAIIISIIYLLVISAIQFTHIQDDNAITALIYPICGDASPLVMGICALVLCISTVLLFVGGVARLIAGLSSQQENMTHILSKRRSNGTPIYAVLLLCSINSIVLFLVHFDILTIENIVALADGFFIANAIIALLAAYKLASHNIIKYTALTLAIAFGCVLFTSHWIVIVIIFALAWMVLFRGSNKLRTIKPWK
ncbi:MAG: amino acid permease [Desulfotalea sp.]